MGHKCFHLISENYDQSPPKFKCTTPSTHTPTSANIKSITTVFYISWTLTIPSPETSRVHQVFFWVLLYIEIKFEKDWRKASTHSETTHGRVSIQTSFCSCHYASWRRRFWELSYVSSRAASVPSLGAAASSTCLPLTFSASSLPLSIARTRRSEQKEKTETHPGPRACSRRLRLALHDVICQTSLYDCVSSD